MTDDDIILALGGPTKVARRLGVRPQLVSGWRTRGISARARPVVFALARADGIALDADEFLRVPARFGSALVAPCGT